MRHCLPALALVLAGALPATAQSGADAEGVAEVALVDGWRLADGSHVAAVEITLEPGWHTYWRTPGEAGVPPQFDWSGSTNLASVGYEWPRPRVFESFGMATIGYRGSLVLPVVLKPERPGEDIDAVLDFSFGVCDDICVPARAMLTARLTGASAEAGVDRITAALADRPQTAGEAGVVAVACGLAPSAAGGGVEVTAEITFAAPPSAGQAAVLETAQPRLWIGAAHTRTEGRKVFARAPVQGAGDGGAILDRSALRLTVLDGGRAVDIRGCTAPG